MANILWVDKDYLVSRSAIDKNVEWVKVEPIVNLVQRKYILRLLGTDLYTKLNNDIDAKITSNTTIPANYKLLIDNYLLDIITYYTIYENALNAKLRFTNKGVQVKNSENSQSADSNDLDLIATNWKNNAELIANELIVYLTINNANYPEYLTNITNAVWAKRTATNVDIYLGGTRSLADKKVKDGNGYFEDNFNQTW